MLFKLENKIKEKVYKRAVAVFTAITVCLSIGVSSSFGMRKWDEKKNDMFKMLKLDASKVIICQGKQYGVKHDKGILTPDSYQYTSSWLEMGIDAALWVSGTGIQTKLAEKITSKFAALSIINKVSNKTKIANTALGTARLVTLNELKTKHGIRINIKWDKLSYVDCFCKLAFKHGAEGLWYQNVTIEFSIV